MKLVNNRRGPLYVQTVDGETVMVDAGAEVDADSKIYTAKHPFIKSRFLAKPPKEITDDELDGDAEPQKNETTAAPAKAANTKAAPADVKKEGEGGKPWHAPDAK